MIISNLKEPGERASFEVEKRLKRRLNDLLNYHKFPGSQPISFQLININEVKANTYVVCEKSDGQRYLLLLEKQDSYLINTKMEFYRVPLNDCIPLEEVTGTLLDGELVLEDNNETNFYIFDALVVKGVNIIKFSLLNRLRLVLSEVLEKLIDRSSKPNQIIPMNLKLKQMYPASASRYIWEHIVKGKKLTHESDGLIYTKDQEEYQFGTTKAILKWKPPELNTVDFGIGLVTALNAAGEKETRFAKLHWGEHGQAVECPQDLYGTNIIFLSEEQQIRVQSQNEIQKRNGNNSNIVIVECRYDKNWYSFKPLTEKQFWDQKELIMGSGGWKFWKFREDKTTPNNYNTVLSVINSIQNPVEEEILFNALSN